MATRRITVLEAEGTVLFSELPALIAEALHDDEMMQAMARIELETELSRMVDDGALTVRNPFTLGPLTFTLGDVLANAVLTADDMRPLLAAKGITLHIERTWEAYNGILGSDFFPNGTYSYSQAAHEIAQAQGWGGERESALNAEMASAINAGQLPTHDRHTGLRLPADGRREFMGLVTVDDVNGWLESRGALYHWTRPQQAALAQAGGDAESSDAMSADAPALPNWKMRIQTEATAMFKRQRKAGAQPAVYSIIDSLAAWCRDNGVKTDSDIFPSAGYIRTHVLSGKHWTPPPRED